jgi:hypothetical protein
LHDDVTFTEFDRNPNFVSDDILLDFVARSKNYEKFSPNRMSFVRDGIINRLMKQ